MKKKCPQCDFENEEGRKFCSNCNIPLIKPEASDIKENPHIKIEEEGQPLELISDKEVEVKNKIKKEEKQIKISWNNKGWKVIFILVCLIFLISFGIFIWPTIYKYENAHNNILVRINRITGHAAYFSGSKWSSIESDKNRTDNKFVLPDFPKK